MRRRIDNLTRLTALRADRLDRPAISLTWTLDTGFGPCAFTARTQRDRIGTVYLQGERWFAVWTPPGPGYCSPIVLQQSWDRSPAGLREAKAAVEAALAARIASLSEAVA